MGGTMADDVDETKGDAVTGCATVSKVVEGRSTAAEEREATVGTSGAMNGCATVADDDDDGGAMTSCATVADDGDGAKGGAMAGAALAVAKADEARGRTILLAFDLAAAEEEGEGRTLFGCKEVFEEVEAGRTILLKIFLAATGAASFSLLLQVEHVLRGDHSP